MSEILPKGYDPSEVEPRLYKEWMDKGYFKADAESDADGRPPYCIVIPPPNVTGTLHMGHALTMAIQDTVTRWKRMSGFETLWLPGTDHAGIATQMVVERDLRVNEGKSRHDIGREEFIKRIWKWKEAKGGRITEQLKVLGCSLDWSRERFTMDEGLSKSVREVFVRLWEEGLIYRDNRLINWCPRCHTALSDLEVEHDEGVAGEMWSFAYPLSDGKGEIVVATTRPETMLGDTAVAVHPDDERYKHLIGTKIRHPLLGYEFPIVADDVLVDPEFGTGAVKITPAHDPNDFECGMRNKLEFINIMNEDGTLNEHCGPYAGLNMTEAREKVKAALTEKGLFRGRKDHEMSIGHCQRCNTVVEPYISKQWFVKIKPLADEAIRVVEEGEIKFIPSHWVKTYYEWMYNIRDWCISRQLWWGHRIPAWYCDDCGEIIVSREAPQSCPKCSSVNLHQDEDVLDTWFSSALWPFSTLGWPDDCADVKRFYPTALMETGFDIIFFWVARMIMMGMHFMDEVPFKEVFLHAMVRDHEGRKMSKSLGNVIDPLDVIYGIGVDDLLEKRNADALALGVAEREAKKIVKATKKLYPEGISATGADALRFTLVSMAGQGRDIKLDIRRVEGYRFFANKIWNASRFAMMNLEDFDAKKPVDKEKYGLAERWILHRLRETVATVADALEKYHFDRAAMAIYHFFWDEFCDWYIEMAKLSLYKNEDEASRHATQHTLVLALDTALKLLHPLMPFVTEEIWQRLPKLKEEAESIMLAAYPKADDLAFAADYADAEEKVALLKEIVRSARNLRVDSGLEAGRKIPLVLQAADENRRKDLASFEAYATSLARLESFAVSENYEKSGPCASGVLADVQLFIPLADLIDVEEEVKRAAAKRDKLEKELAIIDNKLSNKNFVERAPEEIVAKQRETREDINFKLDKIVKHIAELEA